MKLIKLFKNWYQNFNIARSKAGLIKEYFKDTKYVITHAFSIAGVDYFQYEDLSAIPFERGLMCMAFYEEYRMKCDREYLQKHCEVMSDILSNPKEINIFNIKMLNDQMKERIEMTTDVDLLYKLASVAFFTKDENPTVYDAEYNRKKIEFWKKNQKLEMFFFMQPIRDFLPFLTHLEPYLAGYLEISQQMNLLHLERLSVLNSKGSLTDSRDGKKSLETADKH